MGDLSDFNPLDPAQMQKFEAALVIDYLGGRPMDDADRIFIEAWLYERHRHMYDFRLEEQARKMRAYDLERGRTLRKVRSWRDRRGFREFLEKHRLSPARARRLMAIAGLADASPDLLERLRGLSMEDLETVAGFDPRQDAAQRAAINVAVRLLPTIDQWSSDRVFVSPGRLALPQERLKAPGVLFVGIRERGLWGSGTPGGPTFVVEIASPASHARREAYEHNRLWRYWLLDPAARTLHRESLGCFKDEGPATYGEDDPVQPFGARVRDLLD